MIRRHQWNGMCVVGGTAAPRSTETSAGRPIHDLYATSVAPGGPLVDRGDTRVAFPRPPGAGHRDVHLFRRRQPNRAAEPRGACSGLPRDPPAERPHPGQIPSSANAACRCEPAQRHARRRRPSRDSGRGHHRPPHEPSADVSVYGGWTGKVRERIPAGPGTVGGAGLAQCAAERIRGDELVEPRARTARRG